MLLLAAMRGHIDAAPPTPWVPQMFTRWKTSHLFCQWNIC